MGVASVGERADGAGCKVGSESSLGALSGLGRLQYLDVSQCENVGDDTLEGLRHLTELRTLLLAHTQVAMPRRRAALLAADGEGGRG